MGCLVHLGAVWALSGRLGAVLGCLGLLGAVLGSRRILEASWAISGPSISVFCGQLSGDKLGPSIFFGHLVAVGFRKSGLRTWGWRFCTSEAVQDSLRRFNKIPNKCLESSQTSRKAWVDFYSFWTNLNAILRLFWKTDDG